jgi:hypothetical protein
MFAENARLFGIAPSVRAEVLDYPEGVDPSRVTVSELLVLQRKQVSASKATKAVSQDSTPLKQKVNVCYL